MLSSLLVKNTLAQLLSRGLFLIFSFLLIRIITENFGKEGYGIYGFVTALVLFFANFSDWGTQIIAVREASGKISQQSSVFKNTLFLRFVLSVFAFVLINTFVYLYPPWKDYAALVTIGSFVLFPLSLKTSAFIPLQASLRLERIAFTEVFGVALFLVSVVYLLGFGLVGVFYSWIIGTFAAAIFALFLVRRMVSFSFVLDQRILARLIKESLPMGMLLLVFSVYNRIDIVILEHLKGVGDVGVYNLAYKIHENLILGAAFLMGTLFPIFSGKFKNKEQVATLFKKAFWGFAILGALLVIVFFFLSPIAINLLSGSRYEEFAGSVLSLRILLFATFFSYLNHLTGFSLVAFGRQRSSLLIGVGALILNVVANIIFIPQFSYIASSVITGITELFIFVLSLIVVLRTIKWRTSL